MLRYVKTRIAGRDVVNHMQRQWQELPQDWPFVDLGLLLVFQSARRIQVTRGGGVICGHIVYTQGAVIRIHE